MIDLGYLILFRYKDNVCVVKLCWKPSIPEYILNSSSNINSNNTLKFLREKSWHSIKAQCLDRMHTLNYFQDLNIRRNNTNSTICSLIDIIKTRSKPRDQDFGEDFVNGIAKKDRSDM